MPCRAGHTEDDVRPVVAGVERRRSDSPSRRCGRRRCRAAALAPGEQWSPIHGRREPRWRRRWPNRPSGAMVRHDVRRVGGDRDRRREVRLLPARLLTWREGSRREQRAGRASTGGRPPPVLSVAGSSAALVTSPATSVRNSHPELERRVVHEAGRRGRGVPQAGRVEPASPIVVNVHASGAAIEAPDRSRASPPAPCRWSPGPAAPRGERGPRGRRRRTSASRDHLALRRRAARTRGTRRPSPR